MALTGKSDYLEMQLRIQSLELEMREMREAWNRQSGDARWPRGSVPAVASLVVTRSRQALQMQWDALTIPDLRYYEVQIDRGSRFGSPETILTPNPFHTWTNGSGFTGFYFYIRARAVSNDRRAGPWSPKVESPAPDPAEISPVSGVLTLPKRTDIVVVGGTVQTITAISGGWVGRCVTLYFTVAHTVQDNAALRLAGDFSAAANSALTLRWGGDAYGWVEVARTGTL